MRGDEGREFMGRDPLRPREKGGGREGGSSWLIVVVENGIAVLMLYLGVYIYSGFQN